MHTLSINLATLFLLPLVALAQWSDDPAVNTLVSGSEVGCAVTHAVATPSGETWVAWYDSTMGYDLRVQLLNANGEPTLASPLLVADQSLSWVQDFDIACDNSGSLAIAWVSNDTVGSSLISSDGTVVWHHTFDGQGAFMGNAQITGTSDGDVVVGWARENVSQLQRIDPSGVHEWAVPIEVSTSGTLALSDLKPGMNGAVIASFVQYATFSGAKRLKAQSFDALGDAMWSSSLVNVFASGSLQYGNYPEFIADGSGGALLTWYSTSPLMARAQWLDASGALLFGSNGLALTAETSMVHVGPSACMDSSSGEGVVYWTRQNSSQSQAGVHVNRINRNGDRLLGDQGVEVSPLSASTTVLGLTAVAVDDFSVASWIASTITGQSSVFASAIDEDGKTSWGSEPIAIGIPNLERSDQTGVFAAAGFVSVWSDKRSGASRAYAQRIELDGTLGGSSCVGDLTGDDFVNGADLGLFLVEWGECEGCVADLSGDGVVDGVDLGLFLIAWGPC